jgi:hypothetical protein
VSSEKHEAATDAEVDEGCPMRRGDGQGGGGWLLDSGRAPYAQQRCLKGRKKIEIHDVHENKIYACTTLLARLASDFHGVTWACRPSSR